MRFFLLLCCLAMANLGASRAQAPAGPPPGSAATPAPKRQPQAVRISAPLKLDGVLDEAVWQSAPIAT